LLHLGQQLIAGLEGADSMLAPDSRFTNALRSAGLSSVTKILACMYGIPLIAWIYRTDVQVDTVV
jgi:hypothetical protein